ncbi:MAG: phosphopantothenate/pantothenate synthetase [Promethearchaeota archaeon]
MTSKKDIPIIPDDHPRAQSLHYRHTLVDGMHKEIVTPSGLCAHGRGEAFDYILGEQTIPSAEIAMRAAISTLILAQNPVISVNGNVASLVPKEIVQLSKSLGIPLEVNIFYQAPGRLEAIATILREHGADQLLGLGDVPSAEISDLSSNRRIVDPRGIFSADVVLIPLEDGDRAEALIRAGKTVITIDLNPLSRTAQQSHITIVDNLVRTIPRMIEIAVIQKKYSHDELATIRDNFAQSENLRSAIKFMIQYLEKQL